MVSQVLIIRNVPDTDNEHICSQVGQNSFHSAGVVTVLYYINGPQVNTVSIVSKTPGLQHLFWTWTLVQIVVCLVNDEVTLCCSDLGKLGEKFNASTISTVKPLIQDAP